MKKLLWAVLILFVLFFILPFPMKGRVACIQAPCNTTSYVTVFQLLKEKQNHKISRENTSKQTSVSISVKGSENFGNKIVVIRSIDNRFQKKYQIDGKFITRIPQEYPGDKMETDNITVILNPGTYQLEQYVDDILIRTIPIDALDSLSANKNVVGIEISY